MNEGLDIRPRRNYQNKLKHLGKCIKIILLGSRAKHTHTNHSDFDIKEIPFDTLYILQEELNRLPSLKSFDIVDINAVSADFKKLIKETGKVILKEIELQLSRFELSLNRLKEALSYNYLMSYLRS